MNKFWPHIRAALITAHLFAIFVCAFPAPKGAFHRKEWKTPVVQSEIKNWSKALRKAGLTIYPAELEKKLFRLSRKYMNIQRKVVAPFKPYYTYCGTDQSWRMFIAPHRFPARLHIDLYQDELWTPIYQPLSPHTWQADMLESSRMRSVIFRYSWKKYSYPSRKIEISGWAFTIGITIFSGSLWILALSGIRWLGAITPIGGVSLLVGWLALAWSGRG